MAEAEDPQGKVERLFEEALARPEEEREAFLEETCGDAALREEVASLLEAYDQAPDFFEGLASSVVAPMLDRLEEKEASAASDTSDPLEIEGTSLGRYLVEEHLGSGGMGVVYRARDTELGRAVALKFLPPHLGWHEEAERRFLREARAAAALDHPNVATVYEIGEAALGKKGEERRFIAMAYYEGETLKEKLSREGPLPVEEALSYAEEIAEGLARAHAAGIVHRDVKPANVMVTRRGRVKLLDFGIAKLKGTQGITETGDTLGTVAYMAPEQIQGEEVDRRADLFSLGVVLYEMLTGRHPFPGEYRQAIAYQIINEEAEPPSAHRAELSSELDDLVLQCLEKEPTGRYGSAEELLSDLRGEEKAAPKAASSSSASVAEGSASEAEGLLSGRRWPGRRRVAGIGAIGALTVVGLLMAWWLLGGGASEDAAEVMPGGDGPEITERSVAILPFDALGQDEPGPFTEGIHDDLLTRLSNIGDLQVTSRTSVERYRGTELSLPAVAESLGVRWIVEGGVQEAGGLVQVNAQLIDPETDAYVWSDQYQRELTTENLFAIQEEIAEEIAGALEAELTAGEQERIAGAPTEDLEAYHLYVQGRQQLAQFAFNRLETLTEAASYFRRAIERDSSYALAWAGLADAAAYVDFYETYYDWPDTVRAPAVDKEEAARRALELNPNLAEAHASMGHVHYINQNAPAALRKLKKALELKPSYWEAHQMLGWIYVILDRRQKALGHFQLAVELNPQHATARHGLYDAYNSTGQPRKALREARRQQRMGLEGTRAAMGEVRALMSLGRLEEARRVVQKQLATLEEGSDDQTWVRTYLPRISLAQGDTGRARREFQRLRNEATPPRHIVGRIYAALGEPERALEAYQQLEGKDWHFVPLGGIRGLGEQYPSLRNDPRYLEVLHRANRTWGLNPDGTVPEEKEVASETSR